MGECAMTTTDVVILVLLLSAVGLGLSLYYVISRRPVVKTSKIDVSLSDVDEAIRAKTIDGYKIHPLVIDIYNQFINGNPKDWEYSDHHLNCKSSYCNEPIHLWIANDWNSRTFSNLPIEIEKEFRLTSQEINKSLSVVDKKILDAICNKIIVDNKAFLNRLFIS